MALLVEGGIDALTFQNVAERAGVSRATMYRRWPSPAHLAADVIRATASDAIEIVDTGSLTGDLTSVMRSIGAFLATSVGRAAVIAGMQIDVTEAGELGGWSERWVQVVPIFDRALERGELAPAIDVPALFAALAGPLYFRTIVMGRLVDDDWIERVLATVLGSELRGR